MLKKHTSKQNMHRGYIKLYRKIVEKGYDKGNIISMLTARDDPGEKVDDLKEYVLDYIKKPFESADIIKTVKEYFSYLANK